MISESTCIGGTLCVLVRPPAQSHRCLRKGTLADPPLRARGEFADLSHERRRKGMIRRGLAALTGDQPLCTLPAAMPSPLDHNVAHWITHWAEQRPEALAWADDHRRCNFASAAARIERLAGWLSARGVGRGDRIAVWLGNRGATLEALIATARLGAIMLPVNARLTVAEVAFQLDDSRPQVLLVEADWTDRALEAIAAADRAEPVLLSVGTGADTIDDYEQALAAGHAPPPPAQADPNDPIILMYTSGTTGKPKGALLPLRKALYNSLNAERYFGIQPDDTVLIVAPLFHSLGLQILAIPAIFSGAGLIIQEGFDTARVWHAIRREHVTYYGGVPTMHQRLYDALATENASPPSSLRFAFTAGSAAPAELIRAYHDLGLAMKQGYGQTETSTLTCLDSAQTLTKAGSVGRPVHHATLRLVDPLSIEGDVSGWRDADLGAVGEIVVSGPILMLEYWERPEATAQTIRGEWLRTGDLATQDRDGDITLVGRAREMYISGGENVYPAEIEATLVDHPDIEEAAVVAVADSAWGEVGHAYVATSPQHVIKPAEVLAWLESRLARYKQPRKIFVVDALPRTASGKIQKHRLSTPKE